MKNQFIYVGGVLLILFSTLVIILVSCKKTNNNITGTYDGTAYSGNGSPADTVTITAGNGLTSYVITDEFSGAVLNANAISDSLTIPVQQITVKNIHFTWYGTGDVSQGALSLTLYYVNTANDTIAYDFSGLIE